MVLLSFLLFFFFLTLFLFLHGNTCCYLCENNHYHFLLFILTRVESNSHVLAEFLFTSSSFFCLSVLESPFISKTCLICPVILGCLLLGIRGGLNIRVGVMYTGACMLGHHTFPQKTPRSVSLGLFSQAEHIPQRKIFQFPV